MYQHGCKQTSVDGTRRLFLLPSLPSPLAHRRLPMVGPSPGHGGRSLRTVTSTTLLAGLLDKDNTGAWRRFTERYQPMVVAYARALGLSEAEAEDVGQETVMVFVESYSKGAYQCEKGRLRSWLFGIAHHKAMDVLRRRMKEDVVSARTDGTQFIHSLPSPEVSERKWEQEWRRGILKACLDEVAEEVTPKTLRAFQLYVLDQWPVEMVAERLGMTENAVYIAKARLIARMRELRPKMEETW